ncbi:hypothetical protein TorRG33x02_334690 [Trema orientale]|uniref:Uncharacterized protein n=1 Tax=Trema orientale TaxID=63057 RepID=A0A2P5B2C9_TREOI|nr:hypothetical protein TorRG33x02_334690 [Trema orientale]
MNLYSMVFRRLQFTNIPQSNQMAPTVIDTFSGCFTMLKGFKVKSKHMLESITSQLTGKLFHRRMWLNLSMKKLKRFKYPP